MARVLITHPQLGLGGSEARVAWLLQTLQQQHELVLLTMGSVQLNALDESCGTSLDPSRIRIMGHAGRYILDVVGHGDQARGALLARRARSIAKGFDLCVSAYNPLNFGRPAIQFVADFSFLPEVRRRFADGTSALDGVGGAKRHLRRLYSQATHALAGGASNEVEWMRRDLLVANSEYCERVLRQFAGITCGRIVYPPVPGPLGGPAVQDRELSVLSLGRIAADKHVREKIQIVKAVRQRGYDLRLRIVGGPVKGRYARSVWADVQRCEDFVTWHGPLRGVDKWKVIQQCRFGLHFRPGEAFGIAVVEMMRAGCVVLTHAEGFPAEMVNDPRLVFDDVESAIECLSSVLASMPLQLRYSAHLRKLGGAFGVDRFASQIQSLVAGALRGRRNWPSARAQSVSGGSVVRSEEGKPALPEGTEGRKTVTLLGCRVDCISLPGAVGKVEHWIERPKLPTKFVACTGFHGLWQAHQNHEFRQLLNQADLFIPDGVGAILLSRLMQTPLPERIPSIDLMTHILSRTVPRPYRSYFYGDSGAVLGRLIRRVGRQFPRHIIAGAYSPPYRPLSEPEVARHVRAINAAEPDILWVGLGLPKQEQWIARARHRLRVPVAVGVGANFKFLGGSVRRAPKLLGDMGFEWLWRLATEPRTVGRRCLIDGPRFLAYGVREATRGRRSSDRVARCEQASGQQPRD